MIDKNDNDDRYDNISDCTKNSKDDCTNSRSLSEQKLGEFQQVRKDLGIDVKIESTLKIDLDEGKDSVPVRNDITNELIHIPPPLPIDCFQTIKVDTTRSAFTRKKSSNFLNDDYYSFLLKCLNLRFQNKRNKHKHGSKLLPFQPTPIQAQVWPILESYHKHDIQSRINQDSQMKHEKSVSFQSKSKKRRMKQNRQIQFNEYNDFDQDHVDIVAPHNLQSQNNLPLFENLIAIAPTGSGKTLAYGLPILYVCCFKHVDVTLTSDANPILDATLDKRNVPKLKKSVNNNDHIKGLILVPTRELAIQVTRELNQCMSSVVHHHPNTIRTNIDERERMPNQNVQQQQQKKQLVMAIYGGQTMTKQNQLDILNNGENSHISILVATPGRLLDLLTMDTKTVSSSNNDESKTVLLSQKMKEETNYDTTKQSATLLKLHNIQFLVLDEADRMLSQMGLYEQVQKIMTHIQTSSTTTPPNTKTATAEKKEIMTSRTRTNNDRKVIWLFSATYPTSLQEACTSKLGMSKCLVIRVNVLSFEIQRDNHRQRSNKNVQMEGDQNEDLKTKRKAIDRLNDNVNHQNTKGNNNDEIDGIKDDLMINSNEETMKKNQKNEQSSVAELSNTNRTMVLAKIPSHVTQILHVCSTHKKPRKLITTLKKQTNDDNNNTGNNQARKRKLTIVFFATIKTLKYISKLLKGEGWRCTEFHSQLPQEVRERALFDFKAGKISILLATDMAARGIHVKNIEFVINYDFPTSLEQYVHRCGRAGRSGACYSQTDGKSPMSHPNIKATVYSFFHRELAPMALDTISLLKASDAWVDPNLVELASCTKDNRSKKRKKNKEVKCKDNATKREIENRNNNTVIDGNTKKRQRRGGVKNRAKREMERNKIIGRTRTAEKDGISDREDEEFSHLLGNRIIFKRAEHVSDADDSSEEED